MNEWPHHQAHVNGVRIHYVRAGEGPTLILLHGWPEFWWAWHRNVDALAERFDVVVPDLRGFGASEKPPGGAGESYTLDHHVGDLAGLVDALGVERAGLVGHDIGAMVMQGYARLAPDRVRGLFFFDCPYPGIGRRWVESGHVREIWYQSFNQQTWAAELLSDRRACTLYIGGILRHWAHDASAFDDVLDRWIDEFLEPGNLQGGFNWYVAIHEARMAMVRDGAPALSPIASPAYFLWGRSDPILPVEWSDRLGEYFSDYTLEPADDAGHFVHFERPALANERIADFFSMLPE